METHLFGVNFSQLYISVFSQEKMIMDKVEKKKKIINLHLILT